MNDFITFRMELAQCVFSVRCLFQSTKRYCKDYLVSDDIPAIWEITITREDLEAEREILTRGGNGNPSAAYLEVMFLCRRAAQLLPQRDTLLFHGSALAIDGKGILITAKSGTGKSTHARLWRNAYGDRVVMVNDDKPFLRIAEGGAEVYGSPWQGKHRIGSHISAPLKAICILCRDSENHVEQITPREALPVLLQQTFQPEKPDEILRKLQMVELLSRQVKLYRISCNMEPDAPRVVCGALGLDQKEKET